MRKSTLILAGLASAAMVASFAGPSMAGSAASNSGHAVQLHPTHAIIHSSSPSGKSGFKAFATPVKKYTKKSCDIDLSSIPDGTSLNSVTGCNTTVTLSGSAWEKVSVPDSWGSWNCPPAVESCTPNALYSVGQTTATVDFGTKVKVGGFELEPDQFQVETVEVDFYSKADGAGKLVGTITLQPNGSSGALLYGAKAKKGFQSAVITDQAGDDFAIAQVRV